MRSHDEFVVETDEPREPPLSFWSETVRRVVVERSLTANGLTCSSHGCNLSGGVCIKPTNGQLPTDLTRGAKP